MVAALGAALPALGCTLEVIDVDADPVLEARYDELERVVPGGGGEICHHFLARGRLLAALGRDGGPAPDASPTQVREAGF